MPNSKRKKKIINSRTCHGCGGKGWVIIKQEAHWQESGAPDTKVVRKWIIAHTEQQRCIICKGEGIVVDQDGTRTIEEARGPKIKLI